MFSGSSEPPAPREAGVFTPFLDEQTEAQEKRPVPVHTSSSTWIPAPWQPLSRRCPQYPVFVQDAQLRAAPSEDPTGAKQPAGWRLAPAWALGPPGGSANKAATDLSVPPLGKDSG